MAAGLIALGLTTTAAAGYVAAVVAGYRLLRHDPTAGQLDAYIPFEGLTADHAYLRLPKGALVAVYRVQGASEATLSQDDQDAYSRRRASAIAHLLNGGCMVRLHGVRDPAAHNEQATFPSPFLNRVHQAWMQDFATIYDTRRYVAVESPPGMAPWRFRDLCTQGFARLSDFGPIQLTGADLLAFYGDRLDPLFGGVQASPTVTDMCNALAPSQIAADRRTGVVTVSQGGQSVTAQQISIEEWSENDAPSIMDGLLELPLRLEATVVLKPIPKAAILLWLERKRNQENAERENTLVNREFADTADQLQAGRDTACNAQVSITVMAPADELADAVGQVYGHLSGAGIKPTIESAAAGYLWLSRLPGHSMLVRKRALKTSNIGKMWRWDRQPEGYHACDWGKGPIRMFKTISGSPFRFQFHISAAEQEVGHTAVFAPTRGGKTTLMLHLVGGALRHQNVRAYIIDRNLSTRVWGEAAGAAYINPADTSQVALNPFQGPDTREERDFAAAFIRQLSGITDPAMSGQIADAVNDIFTLPPDRRSLATVWKGAFRSGPLKDALKRWADPSDVGALINAPQDSLSLRERRLVIFDFTQLFKDPAQAAAVTAYLFHRIRQQSVADASPHLIYAEEVAPMLTDPVFGPNIQVVLREHAKLRGVCVLVFQDVGAALNGPIGESIRTNARRQIIFPAPSAQAKDYEPLSLSQEEWSFVKGQHAANDKLVRPVLIRDDNESVIIEADLTPLGKMLPLYRGGTEPTARMLKAQKDYGTKWQDHFASV